MITAIAILGTLLAQLPNTTGAAEAQTADVKPTLHALDRTESCSEPVPAVTLTDCVHDDEPLERDQGAHASVEDRELRSTKLDAAVGRLDSTRLDP